MNEDEINKLWAELAGLCFELVGKDGATVIYAFANACYEAGRTAEKQECKRVCELEINRLSAIGEHRAALAVGICAATIDARGKP